MSLQPGKDLVLKISDGGMPPSFVETGGLTATAAAFSAAPVEASSLVSPGWREEVPGAGLSSARLSGSGVFLSGSAAALVRAAFFAGTAPDWQVILPGLGLIEGPFRLIRLDYAGPYAAEMTFSLTLQSAGEITFTEE